MSTFDLLLAPFAVCLLLTGIHCYLGLFVVSRGIIFVDLALAQLAAFGSAVALIADLEAGSAGTYAFSVAFTVVGAAVFALTRVRQLKVPQEAIIGIIYAICSAYTILILDRSPHGHDQIKAMLVGSILYVDWSTVVNAGLIYASVGAVHFIWRAKFAMTSLDITEARRRKIPTRTLLWWDFVFYVTFGVVVTSSVQLAGVLLVFSFLVIPAVNAMQFASSMRARLTLGWVFSAAVSLVGLCLSAAFDMPSGAAIVGTFGVAWIAAMVIAGVNSSR